MRSSSETIRGRRERPRPRDGRPVRRNRRGRRQAPRQPSAAFASPPAASWTRARTRTSGSACSDAWRNASEPAVETPPGSRSRPRRTSRASSDASRAWSASSSSATSKPPAASGWRRTSSARARVYDRYMAAPLTVQTTPRTTPNTMTPAIPRPRTFIASRTAPVAPMATGTPIPSTTAWTARRSPTGTTWNAAFTDVRVVPSVRTMSARRATPTSAKRPSVAAPGPATTRAIATRSTATTAGFSTSPMRSPKRRISGPATKARNTIAARLSSAVNAARNRVRSSPL